MNEKMRKTKKIICANKDCKKIEEISLYSNIKYCNECKEKFKKLKILQCIYCKKNVVSPNNIKEIVCNECKKKGKKSSKYLKIKKVICFYCKQETLVSISASMATAYFNSFINSQY